MSALALYTAALALFGVGVAIGVLNKMRAGETRPCMRGAIVLIAVGLLGQAAGAFADEWLPAADTATVGGVVVLLLATQRVPSWFAERWANPLASVIAIATGVIFLLTIATASAHAQAPPATVDCRSMAMTLERIATYRDTGANLDKVVGLLRKLAAGSPVELVAVYEREVRRMWREGLAADDAALAFYVRYTSRLGDMGRES